MGFPQNYKCFNKYLIFAVIYNLTGKKKPTKKLYVVCGVFYALKCFFLILYSPEIFFILCITMSSLL